MKLSDRSRYSVLAIALLATLLAVYFAPPAEEPAEAIEEAVAPQAEKLQPPGNLFAATDAASAQKKAAAKASGMLPAPRNPLDQEPGDLFQMDRPPPPPPARAQRPAPPPPPVAPPLPYTYMGSMSENGEQSLFLLKHGQGKPYIAKAGDILDSQYRLDAIQAKSAEFTYLPLNQKQSMPIGSANAGASGDSRPRSSGNAPAAMPDMAQIQERLKQMMQQNGATQ